MREDRLIPITKCLMSQPVSEIEARRQTEAQRQMRERGSISPMRGYKPRLTVDIQAEKVAGNLYLVTPLTPAGHGSDPCALPK